MSGRLNLVFTTIGPFVVSILALIISAGSFWLSYKNSSLDTTPPAVFTKVEVFELTLLSDEIWKADRRRGLEPILKSRTVFQFSASNNSPQSMQILSCTIEVRGVLAGAGGGGIGPRNVPCVLTGNEALPTTIDGGQTKFFSASIEHILPSANLEELLLAYKIEFPSLLAVLRESSTCQETFGWSDGKYLPCQVRFHGDGGIALEVPTAGRLIIQTGQQQLVSKPLVLSPFQDWPWNN